MTPEQLDEIEKLADRGAFKAAGFYALPLVKAVREAREARDAAGHSAAELMKLLMTAEKERDEARVELEHAVAEGGALYEAKVAQSEAEQERDEARAEVERLRDVVRQVHSLAEVAVSGTAVWGPLVAIHKLTKEKEG